MIGSPPPKDIPTIWADFNAVGLSDEDGDTCCYSLHKDRLKEISPSEGIQYLFTMKKLMNRVM